MYADDTTLTSTLVNFGKLSNVTGLERELNEEMSKIYGWLLSNKLTLNTAKSKFMIFFKHPKVILKLNLNIAGNAIEQCTVSVSVFKLSLTFWGSILTKISHGNLMLQKLL